MSRRKYIPKESWTDDMLKSAAAPYNRRIDFKNGDRRAWNIARKKGADFMDIICSHMDPPKTKAYSDEELIVAASLHMSRSNFEKYNRNEYHAAHKRGKEFLDRICSHMLLLVRRGYKDEELYLIALQYEREVDFKNGHSGAYSAAYDRGPEFLKKICSHMKRGNSKPEKTILEEVRKYFPSAKKFMATKLNVPDIDYIKRLEVDILIPELGLAIEYDGRYHHSLKGLARGHPTWKLEHLKKYHEIKDRAFLALGIKILHIKDKDWRENSQNCIDKCLSFLGIINNRTI